MKRRTMQYGEPRAQGADPVLVLELDDVELVEETFHRRHRHERYPPAMSDHELRQLVDVCTFELCQHAGYGYGSHPS